MLTVNNNKGKFAKNCDSSFIRSPTRKKAKYLKEVIYEAKSMQLHNSTRSLRKKRLTVSAVHYKINT